MDNNNGLKIKTITNEEKQKLVEESKKYIHSLSWEDVKKLKKIGTGTDASVYKINKDLFLKLYDSEIKAPTSGTSNPDFVRTTKPIGFKNNFKFQGKCYDCEGVRLGYDQIINFAKSRQHDISHTYLPLNPCYIDGSFKGCIIKGYSGHLPIDSFRSLPEKYKLIIIRRLIAKFRELVNKNIYPIDLYNKQSSNLPHNNVIINALLDPKIIDLDGKSVAYTSIYDEVYLQHAVFGLSTLVLEFLFDQDLSDYFSEFDQFTNYYKDYFKNKGVPDDMVEEILSANVTLDSLENFIIGRQRKR